MFQGTYTTERGLAAHAKMIAGEGSGIRFARAVAGDGVWPEDSKPWEATELISPKRELNMRPAIREDNTHVKTVMVMDNVDLAEGFYVREIGVMAEEIDNPDAGEFLYTITVEGGGASWFAPYDNQIDTHIYTLHSMVERGVPINVVVNLGGVATMYDIEGLAPAEHQHKVEDIIGLAELVEKSGTKIIASDTEPTTIRNGDIWLNTSVDDPATPTKTAEFRQKMADGTFQTYYFEMTGDMVHITPPEGVDATNLQAFVTEMASAMAEMASAMANVVADFNADSLAALLDGKFLPYGAAPNTDGAWDHSDTAPTGTKRLNYSGELHATKVYGAVFNE